MANVGLLTSIESIVGSNDTAALILSWSRSFRRNDLTVEDTQDRLATLDVRKTDLPLVLQKRIVEARRELDAIRWGMCEAGQHAAIGRILAEFEPLLANHKAKSAACFWNTPRMGSRVLHA